MNLEHRNPNTSLVLADEVYRVQGAIFEVNRVMGRGFLEAVYQECLGLEFSNRGIPFRAFPALALTYKGIPLTQTYRPDFICFDLVVVELKAVRDIAPEHRAQVLNYLRATGLEVGLLVNFGGGSKVTVTRMVLQDLTANPREDARTDPAS